MEEPTIEIGINADGHGISCISDLENIPKEKYAILMEMLKTITATIENNYKLRFTEPDNLTPTEKIRAQYTKQQETGQPPIQRPISVGETMVMPTPENPHPEIPKQKTTEQK